MGISGGREKGGNCLEAITSPYHWMALSEYLQVNSNLLQQAILRIYSRDHMAFCNHLKEMKNVYIEEEMKRRTGKATRADNHHIVFHQLMQNPVMKRSTSRSLNNLPKHFQSICSSIKY